MEYKTVRGYLAALRAIELVSPSLLKGYDKLSKIEQDDLNILNADLSNALGELKE